MGTMARKIKRQFKRLRRAAKRLTKRKDWRLVRRYFVLASFAILLIGVPIAGRQMKSLDYNSLLYIIAKGESHGNYNAYFGHPGNISLKFTSMTVPEVLAWQQTYIEQGSHSSAVGRYQLVHSTLNGLVAELNIRDDDLFDEALQDRLAIRLLERRGLNDYVDGKISREQLAHNLSKEWAALPRVIGENPTASYYAGDGLNKVHVSINEIFTAIATVKNQQ